MIWDIGTPSAPDRSLTVTPDSTVTGPVGGAGACWRGGACCDRSRAARASRPRALPPSITTRRRRPPAPPPRGRIGRFGLFGPSAMRDLSVETRELRLDADGSSEGAGKGATRGRPLEARRVAARVRAPTARRRPDAQHAVHLREADERMLRRAAATPDTGPERRGMLTRRLAPPRPRPRARPRSSRRLPLRPPRPRRR